MPRLEARRAAGLGQVGCVYTAQGFEYDWSGVILGPDLVWRGDRWVAQPGKSFDTQVKRASLAEFDRAVRNTYKVLLTRGMLGSAVAARRPGPVCRTTRSHLMGRPRRNFRNAAEAIAKAPSVVGEVVGWQ